MGSSGQCATAPHRGWKLPLAPLPQRRSNRAQPHIQAALGEVQGEDPTASGQSVPALSHPQKEDLLFSSLCPLSFLLSLSNTEQCPLLSSFPPSGIQIYW